MTNKSLFRIIFTVLALIAAFPSLQTALAMQEEAEETMKSTIPLYKILDQSLPKEERWFANYYYDIGNVVQASRRGKWAEMTGDIGYRQNNITAYGSFSHHRRLREDDYTSNIGAYFNYKNYYFHQEFGNGWNVSYIYRYQNLLEVSHKLYKNLSWQAGYTWRRYKGYNTHIMRPGLIYYFGNHYVSADYGMILIDNRSGGPGQYVSLKGNIELVKNIRLSGGATAGEWLYDIYGYHAKKESGYILFTLLEYHLMKQLFLRIGYSYGTEKPKFIKRSLMVSATIKL